MINKKDLLVISGSISNSLDKYKPIKLEGKPIVLTTNNKLKMLKHHEVRQVMQSIGRIFRNKPELLLPLMGQLKASLTLEGETTLSTTYLYRYLYSDHRVPIIVFWNGTTDKTIINRFYLRIKVILNITSYSDNNDNNFNLKLYDVTGQTNKLLYSAGIGHHEKNGRMLNLMETHDLVCDTKHEITHSHDPMTDVIITKCLFNYIIKEMGPIQLYKYCKTYLCRTG